MQMQTIYDYMRKYSGELSERILSSYKPLHGPADPDSPVLSLLKRALLPAQKLVVMAMAKYLKMADAVRVCGECGVGKTLIAMAAAWAHAEGKPHTSVVMCAPHLTEKWAREVFASIPGARVFLIHDLRNGGDPKQPHGVFEVAMKNGRPVRQGWSGSLNDLRAMGRKGWKQICPAPAWFILGRERGKLSYSWKHTYKIAKSGPHYGSLVNVDTGRPVVNTSGEILAIDDFLDAKRSETVVRSTHKEDRSGTQVFSPLWEADRTKLQRMAPLDFIGRYMKGWFDYGVSDEAHELNGDTAQGNGLAVLARACRKNMALTGTLMGGYAEDIFNVLFRMDAPMMIREGHSWGAQGRRVFQETYGAIEETYRIRPEDATSLARRGRGKKTKVTVKRRPGASPLLFGKYLMNGTVFLFLEDISDALPSYEEQVFSIEMSKEQTEAYEALEEEIKSAMRVYPKGGASITSIMMNSLLLYPDHPFGMEPLWARMRDENGQPIRVKVATPENLNEDVLYPKEQALINEIRKDRREGRRTMVFATYTGAHDVTARLEKILSAEGFRVAVLRSTVPTEKREAWIEKRVKEGVDVVLTHPRLVQTGLDLLDFPSLAFFETGYSLYTLRQASRRSWRIPQTKDVRVKFFAYRNTVQERCLRLMGHKLMIALSVEGKFAAGEGLSAANDEATGDILTAIAQELVSEAKVGESADAVWLTLARQQKLVAQSQSALQPEIPEADILSAYEEPVLLGELLAAQVDAATQEYIPNAPEQAPSQVLRFEDAFLRPHRRGRKRVVDNEQMSLFDFAGVA